MPPDEERGRGGGGFFLVQGPRRAAATATTLGLFAPGGLPHRGRRGNGGGRRRIHEIDLMFRKGAAAYPGMRRADKPAGRNRPICRDTSCATRDQNRDKRVPPGGVAVRRRQARARLCADDTSALGCARPATTGASSRRGTRALPPRSRPAPGCRNLDPTGGGQPLRLDVDAASLDSIFHQLAGRVHLADECRSRPTNSPFT